MNSGGAGACRSRGRREARPNPVSRTCPSAQFTRRWAGFRSLCTRPRAWSLPREAAMPTAKGRKLPTAMGAPSSRSSGSPPGSSSMSMLPPRSRSSARGRTAHAPSNTSFKPYSWARLSRQLGLGCSEAGTTASMALGSPSSASRQVLQKTRSPSAHKTWRRPSRFGPKLDTRLICRTPPASWLSPSG